MSLIHRSRIPLLLLFFFSASGWAETYEVDTPAAYNAIKDDLVAGDTVILANGVWRDFEILLSGKGTPEAPITLTAKNKGQVILSGQSNLRLAGEYLHANGLVFKNGYTPTSAVIEFRRNKDHLAYHSRVSEMVIDNYSNPDKQESDYWVAIYGQHNRFDHNHLVGKRNKGVTLAVRLNDENSQQNYHQIDHNYFGYRPTFGSNGGETLRIGTSHYSLTDSYTLVENNYFEHTNGEVEIISVKSGRNTLRGNVFYEAQGTLTLRHGNHNLIENNVFIGNGVAHTGGIRVINKYQTVRNNYLQGLTGYRFGSGFTVMNGVPDSPINRYHQVDGANIANNTFIDVEHIHLAAGSDAERSAVPINSKMQHNLVINQTTAQPFSVFDDISGINFDDNVSNITPHTDVKKGFNVTDVELERAANGLLYAADQPKNLGASRDLTVITKQQVGVSWYPKQPASIDFDSGQLHQIAATAEALSAAVAAAESGDIIEIAPGSVIVPRLIPIDKVITIRSAALHKTQLSFERTALFEIRNGGSLKLQGLKISGQHSPDAAGNSVIRTQKWGMFVNYRFELLDAIVEDLNVNHSFHFFSSGKGAFADRIAIANSKFKQVSGDVLRLDTEIEDLGIYNAEYVALANNQFSQVNGALLKLYRGGTDESTFGPHLQMFGNQLSDVGNGKRNKTGGSLFLHGVQVTHMDNNEFDHTAPVIVEHTVGEPVTRITNNLFMATAAPRIEELRADGPHTAELSGNTVTRQEASQ